MDNDIRNEQEIIGEELTTADLAVAGDANTRKIENEAIVAESRVRPEASRATGPGMTAGTAAAPAKMAEEVAPLFGADEANNLRARWDGVQVGFVDEPRQAVEEADRLVAATMKRLTEIFAEERQKLEHQWDRGDSISTEDLRLALRHYRSFFSRLLNF